jgi:hypothetical protein
MRGMFVGAASFNCQVVFDTSKVTDMSFMFCDAINFRNGNIGAVNTRNLLLSTSNVVDMTAMFQGATLFDAPGLVDWDVSRVTSMNSMFTHAGMFDQPLDQWFNKLKSVKIMTGMFAHAKTFDQNLSSWDLLGIETTAFNGAGKPIRPVFRPKNVDGSRFWG